MNTEMLKSLHVSLNAHRYGIIVGNCNNSVTSFVNSMMIQKSKCWCSANIWWKVHDKKFKNCSYISKPTAVEVKVGNCNMQRCVPLTAQRSNETEIEMRLSVSVQWKNANRVGVRNVSLSWIVQPRKMSTTKQQHASESLTKWKTDDDALGENVVGL